MIRRLIFVIVYLLLLLPSYLCIAFIMIIGHIAAILIWMIFGNDLDDMSDKIFDVMGWIANIPYKIIE